MELEAVIKKWLGMPLLEVSPLAGGDINQVFRLHFGHSRDLVLKLNSKDRYPGMFEKEAAGLKLLESAGCRTPGIEMSFVEKSHQFLILESIEEGRPLVSSWEKFGHQLAKLHLQTQDVFGLNHNNYIGSLNQFNEPSENWIDFFISARLKPLIDMAKGKNSLDSKHIRAFDSLFSRLDALIPKEKPALLHGDLWSGNLMFDTLGEPVFIDPAVYFGHREVDIAMTRMFGGFNPRFLESYNEVFPLEMGWEDRVALHNLYPTLVHLVLFGNSYLSGIESALRRFA